MSSLTNERISDIKITIENNREDLARVISNYKSNIQTVNLDLDGINFDYWEDNVATKFSDYCDELKNGVVSKLNDSVSESGSLARLEELINDIYDKCCHYQDNYFRVKDNNPDLTYSNGNFVANDDSLSSEDVATINRELNGQKDIIEGLLNELSTLRFDSVVVMGTTSMADLSVYDVSKTINIEPLVINQFDRVEVYIKMSEDSEPELKTMYYLGTDSKGRSYFSESKDRNAKVYRTDLNRPATTAQTWLNDTDKLGDPLLGPNYANARLGFVIFGGNTGDMNVGNILDYPNGHYTGDANFNTSLYFDNSMEAPKVVEQSGSSQDTNNTYHVSYVDVSTGVSLSDLYESKTVSLDDHPVIALKPGEKITTKYNGHFLGIFEVDWGICKESGTIGSNDQATYLVWDSAKGMYYVLDGNGGYSTSTRYTDYGRGIKYVSVESLLASDTSVTIK